MSSPTSERFTLIEESHRPGPYQLSQDVLELNSAKTADHDLQYIHNLREAFPDMVVTGIPTANIPLLSFANAGFATYTVDKETDSYYNWRGYTGPSVAVRGGSLAEVIHFAKYRYTWAGEDFILYNLQRVQYILKEIKEGEIQLGPSKITDDLIKAVGHWLLDDIVWVFDGYWYQDKSLYQQIKQMSWDKVILDEDMKKELTSVATNFFDSKDVYDDLGVPWKRGLMFYGPPGNGKTISIKALMHTLLFERGKRPIPTLYVKAAPYTSSINAVFRQARALAPCMLILEDIETIVTSQTRSYFFNQMDGLENNDGLFVVGSTNFLDRLDPGLTKRPSRFDRKYLFPLPNEHERELYCQFWRRKTSHKKDLEFPSKLCPAMAKITSGFSFAFLQECFVATLLVLAHQNDAYGNDEGLEKYELWRVFREQADVLRKEIETEGGHPLVGHPAGPSHRSGPDDALALPGGFPMPSHVPGLPEPLPWSTGLDSLKGCGDMQWKSRGLLSSFGDMSFQEESQSLHKEPGVVPMPYSGMKFNTINSAAYEMRK